MNELLNNIGLHPEKWQNWIHCGIDEWLVNMMLQGGANTLLFYFLFSSLLVLGYKWNVLNRIFTKMWGIWLAIVFIECGLMHFTHTWAKIYPILYSFSITYPLLQFSMLMVLIETIKSIKYKWKNIRTVDEFNSHKDKIFNSVDKIMNEIEKSDFTPEFKKKALQKLREEHDDI